MKFKLIIIIIQLTVLLLFACGNNASHNSNDTRRVRGIAAAVREQPDEAAGFGSLSFLSKVDITSPQEAVIRKLFFREGDYVREGQVIVQLENPQINIAVERAENNFSQALAAHNLSNSRLLEGIFQAEAQLLVIDKAAAELALAKIRWEENKRKHLNQERLFEAGGLHTEAILVSRFSIEAEWEQILLMERELDIRRIGCRDQDLVMAGIDVPSDETERRNALVYLMTSTLRAELEASQARLDAAEKELASFNITLSELSIHSPASGIVGARYLEEGERVRLQDKIISLIDTASLYAIFPVREKDALRIEKGMPASVLIDGTGDIFDGIVDLVYPQADSQTLSFLVRVLLLEPQPGSVNRNLSANGSAFNTGLHDVSRLKPGMFTRVTVTLGPPKRSVYIPESAVFNTKNNEGSVFIINGSILTERNITFGHLYGEEREVITGLNAGELIVLRPDSDLREGTSVTVMQ